MTNSKAVTVKVIWYVHWACSNCYRAQYIRILPHLSISQLLTPRAPRSRSSGLLFPISLVVSPLLRNVKANRLSNNTSGSIPPITEDQRWRYSSGWNAISTNQWQFGILHHSHARRHCLFSIQASSVQFGPQPNS